VSFRAVGIQAECILQGSLGFVGSPERQQHGTAAYVEGGGMAIGGYGAVDEHERARGLAPRVGDATQQMQRVRLLRPHCENTLVQCGGFVQKPAPVTSDGFGQHERHIPCGRSGRSRLGRTSPALHAQTH
jgi:hypothetical protein